MSAAAPARVLMLCPNFGPDRPLVGGAERQAEKLSLELQARGCVVEVVTARENPAWPAYEVINGLAVHRYPISDLTRVLPRGAGVPNLLLRAAQTRRALRAMLPRFDVLHCHMASPFTAFACDAATRAGVPVLCKVACGGELFDLRTTAEVTLGAARLSRKMVKQVRVWAAISDEIARSLVEWGVDPARIERVPNGVEVPPAVPLEPGGLARRFLYLGRIAGNRDHGLMLRAFERLLETVPDAELAIVGSGELEAEVRRRVEEMPLGRARVRLEGYGDSANWLRWAHAVVQPSLMEGMSNTLLEAMSAARPCVATDIPPNREVLHGGAVGLLTPLGDAESMAAALLRLATIPGEAARIGDAARVYVQRSYQISSVAERYLAVYRKLAAA